VHRNGRGIAGDLLGIEGCRPVQLVLQLRQVLMAERLKL
jgi:hypothetical protein